jgi:hypothetical protein
MVFTPKEGKDKFMSSTKKFKLRLMTPDDENTFNCPNTNTNQANTTKAVNFAETDEIHSFL